MVLTPTRELAVQISEQFGALGALMGLRHAVVIGGVGQLEQSLELAGTARTQRHGSIVFVDELERLAPTSCCTQWGVGKSWCQGVLVRRACLRPSPVLPRRRGERVVFLGASCLRIMFASPWESCVIPGNREEHKLWGNRRDKVSGIRRDKVSGIRRERPLPSHTHRNTYLVLFFT